MMSIKNVNATAQQYFFIDGSVKQVSYAREIVSLNNHNEYKLILTNYYANKTVEVDIVYEIRIYNSISEQSSSKGAKENSSLFDYSNIFSYTFILIIIILVVLFILFYVKSRRPIENLFSAPANPSSKKTKNRNKEKSTISKEVNRKINNKKSSKRSTTGKAKDTGSTIPDKISLKKSKPKDDPVSPGYCGFCGKPVGTPFCKYCGHEV